MALKVMEEYRKTQVPGQTVGMREREGGREGSERGGRRETGRGKQGGREGGGRGSERGREERGRKGKFEGCIHVLRE